MVFGTGWNSSCLSIYHLGYGNCHNLRLLNIVSMPGRQALLQLFKISELERISIAGGSCC